MKIIKSASYKKMAQQDLTQMSNQELDQLWREIKNGEKSRDLYRPVEQEIRNRGAEPGAFGRTKFPGEEHDAESSAFLNGPRQDTSKNMPGAFFTQPTAAQPTAQPAAQPAAQPYSQNAWNKQPAQPTAQPAAQPAQSYNQNMWGNVGNQQSAQTPAPQAPAKKKNQLQPGVWG